MSSKILGLGRTKAGEKWALSWAYPRCRGVSGAVLAGSDFGELLGLPVLVNRITVTMKPGDRAVLGQYSGPSLPEGVTCLPPGASIKWILVTVRDVAVTEFTV